MLVRRLRLVKFKRFDDLTIDLGENPSRLVALVGPNGCGKSSVFDAFEEKLKDVKSSHKNEPVSFYSKCLFSRDEDLRGHEYRRHEAIELDFSADDQEVSKKTFHIRSAYRFTPTLKVDRIAALPDLLDDHRRSCSSIAIDERLQENYQRLLGLSQLEWERGDKPGNQVRDELLGRINRILEQVLDVRISSLGQVLAGKGQLYFEKEDATNFPYQNLSAGEKEIIDIIIDLVVRRDEFNDTIYAIDEPELHLNTSIQRKLLVAIESLIPADCQLWVATHSVGFLRALQDELSTRCAVLDFSESNVFVGHHTIRPMKPSRSNWRRIFATAIDDLVGLLAPELIVYCEGRPEPGISGEELGLDAAVYNEIFGSEHPEALFISSGGTGQVRGGTSLAIRVLEKAFLDVGLLLLNDRDEKSEAERDSWLAEARHHRMLKRREIENYLLDFNVLLAFCANRNRVLPIEGYEAIVSNIDSQDLKAGSTMHQLKQLCGESRLTNSEFLLALAPMVRGSSIYPELRDAIFG